MLSIWLLVFFVIFTVLYYASNQQPQTKSLSIQQVIEQVESDENNAIMDGAVNKPIPKFDPLWHEISGEIR